MNQETILQKAKKTIKLGVKSPTPRLIILMGLPGSGKSYVSNYLHKKYGFTVLSGENVTFALYGTGKCSANEYASTYKILRQLAAKLLVDGYSVVIDGTNLKYAFRKQIYDDVCCPDTALLYLKVDDKTALSRISDRGINYQDKKDIKSLIDRETFNKFKEQLEEPLPSENAVEINSDDQVLLKVGNIVSE